MTQARSTLLTVRAIRCVGVEVPMTYALGTSRGTITKAPLLLIDLDTEEGVTGRSYLWCYFPAAMPAIARILEEVERVVKGERVAPPTSGQACRALRADRRAGHRAHGDGGFRHGGLGCAGDRRGLAARDAARQRAKAHSCLQFLRPRPDGAGQSGGRGGKAPRRRLPRDQAEAWLSDAARGSRGAARGEEARRRRGRGDGRLQPGAQPGGGARTRPRARWGRHLLAGGADPPR